MNWSERDALHVWHPYTQMQTASPALAVVKAKGASLELEDGRILIDAISSWWVTVHGHAHPYIADAIGSQAHQLEQVIFAGFTHPQAVRLSERLCAKLPPAINRVFFSDNGSTAVEVAIKMAWQYWTNQGQPRNRILALEGAYHGDTFGAMSASARSVFSHSFSPLLFEVEHLPNLNISTAAAIANLEAALAKNDVAMLILEPLVQGAGGMCMYPVELLDLMTTMAQKAGVPVIFDEVMTGFYRTGSLFAADQCQSKPDIMCLSKGLTGGFLPLSVTACTDAIYNAFLSDDRAKMLFHGHSFTANALGCAAANASLDLFESPETQASIQWLQVQLQELGERLIATGKVKNVRRTGCILAFDLPSSQQGYLNLVAVRLKDAMLAKGILIRPLGEVVYLLPPYCISQAEIDHVGKCLLEFLGSEP